MAVVAMRGLITGLTSAQPPVVTSVAHGLANSDIIRITETQGTRNINNRRFRVNAITTDTFELEDPETLEDIDGTIFGTYTTGGRWNQTNREDGDRVFFQP